MRDHSNSGAEVEVDAGQKQWLLDNGYISESEDVAEPGTQEAERGRYVTSPPANQDPTLAQNREAPGEPKPHLANQDDEGTPQAEPDPHAGLNAEPIADTGPEVKFTKGKAEKNPVEQEKPPLANAEEGTSEEEGKPAKKAEEKPAAKKAAAKKE